MDATCLRSMRQPVCRRHGMISSQALVRNEETWHGMPRETIKWKETIRGNTDAHDRDGVVRIVVLK